MAELGSSRVPSSGTARPEPGNASRLAYVVGGDAQSAVTAVDVPVAEFVVFLKRHGGVLLDQSEIGGSWTRFVASTLRQPQVALAFNVAARHREFDAFVVSGEDIGLPLIFALRLRALRIPVHVITHGSYFSSRKFRFLLKALRRVEWAHFLCLSESLRNVMVELGGKSTNVHNCGYGVDTEFFSPGDPPSGKRPLVVSAGVANRDYETLVAAVAGLPADVRIAADSQWYPKVVVVDQTLPGNVEIGSCGSYAALRTLYEAASVVVVPLYEAVFACGYAVIIEAMAMGKVVVATRTSAPADFIEDGVNGFYVDVGDVKGLRQLLQTLVNDPARCEAVGSAARRSIEQQFSTTRYCDRILDVVRPQSAAEGEEIAHG